MVKLTFWEAWHFKLIFGEFLVFFLVTLQVIRSADSSVSIFVGQKTHHDQIMAKNSSKTTKPPSKTAPRSNSIFTTKQEVFIVGKCHFTTNNSQGLHEKHQTTQKC